MKTIFIPAHYKEKIILDTKSIARLPKKIGLVSTIQFSNHLDDIKKQIESTKRTVLLEKGSQPRKGQILGCDFSCGDKIKSKIDAFLYIGDGQFHPIGLAMFKKKVFCFNPYSKKFYEVDKSNIESYEKRKKGALLKFLSSDSIGILVSTKKGQNNLKKALNLKEKLEKKGKTAIILIFDTLDPNDLENFPFIDCFVNTACPRIIDDSERIGKSVVNLSDIPK